MNERERFDRLFRGERVDRPPLLEEGVRDEVIECWRTQGLPAGQTHVDLFGLTPHEIVGPDLRFRSRYTGRVLRLPLKDYRKAFDVSLRRFPRDWKRTVRRLRDRRHLVGLWASRGFFQALGVSDWPSLEAALMAVAERPDDLGERLALYGEYCARMLEITLQDITPDFVYLSEPISNNHGPLISPRQFQALMIPAYRRVIDAARAQGQQHILGITYGNSAALFPLLVRAGVNILWVSEAVDTPAMDYRHLRRHYGPGLGLIGGIPLRLLQSRSPAALARGFREIVAPLLRSGRYIPLASGRVREEIPWPAYCRYRELLAKILAGWHQSP